MSDWTHKDEWRKFGKDFLVTITRHSVTTSSGLEDLEDGPHRWAVYAYVYPKHPYFAQFINSGGMTQEACTAMPLHCYPSLFRTHVDSDNGSITSFQVGADYNHLHDYEFTHYATKDDAYEVFRDADRLHKWLTARANP